MSVERGAPVSRKKNLSGAARLGGLIAVLWFGALSAHAVVVRGTVTDPLGAVVINARVELVQGSKMVAIAHSGVDGSFEIRSTAPGRFRLLTVAPTFATSIGDDFYGGVLDVVSRNVVLEISSLTEQVTVTATGIPTPLQQASSPVSLVNAFDLSTRAGVIDEMRQAPGIEMVQQGQTGGVGASSCVAATPPPTRSSSTASPPRTSAAPSTSAPSPPPASTPSRPTAAPTASSTAATPAPPSSPSRPRAAPRRIPCSPTPATPATSTPTATRPPSAAPARSSTTTPASAASTPRTPSRSTATTPPPRRPTSATAISGNLQARFTLRNAVSATGLPGAHDFYGISNDGKQGDQDLYSGLTLEDRALDGRWHNLVRYAITRKREQEHQYAYVGTPLLVDGYPEYFGNLVTIHGANGYQATGQAAFFSPNSDSASNRDELYYQSDYAFTHHLTGLFGFRYENERGSFVEPDYGEDEIVQRTNFEYTLQFQGDVKNRFFYSAGGAIEKNHLYGIAGTPRLGFAYVPVRVSNRWFRGTKIRANAATGVQEPTLALQYASLYDELLQAGDTAAITAYNVTQPTAERSRTYDIGVDQNIRGERLVFKAGYFHNVFDHQLEGVDYIGLEQYFNIPAAVADQIYEAYLNSLAYRAQGFETEIDWQALKHLTVRGGYTYLDSKVVQSFATDAVNANEGMPTDQPQHPRRRHRSPLPAGRCPSLPPRSPHRLLRGRVRRPPRRPRHEGLPLQPQRRLHLPRRPRHHRRQHPPAPQPRPRLRLRQARRQHVGRRQPPHHHLRPARQPPQPAAHRPHRLSRSPIYIPPRDEVPFRRQLNQLNHPTLLLTRIWV